MDEEKLILDNIGLIYLVLKRLNLNDKIEDYYDIAMIGLVQGAKSYNAELGYTACTYLYKSISNQVLSELRKEKAMKRIDPNDCISLSVPIAENLEFEDMLSDNIDIEQDFVDDERNKRLYEEISKLSELEQLVLKTTFGLKGFNKITQKELSILKGYNQSYISRVKHKALIKLRVRLNDLQDYL